MPGQCPFVSVDLSALAWAVLQHIDTSTNTKVFQVLVCYSFSWEKQVLFIFIKKHQQQQQKPVIVLTVSMMQQMQIVKQQFASYVLPIAQSFFLVELGGLHLNEALRMFIIVWLIFQSCSSYLRKGSLLWRTFSQRPSSLNLSFQVHCNCDMWWFVWALGNGDWLFVWYLKLWLTGPIL